MFQCIVAVMFAAVLSICGCGKKREQETFHTENKTEIENRTNAQTEEKTCVLPKETIKKAANLLTLTLPKRKKAFIAMIAPAVLKANCIINKEREILIRIKEKIKNGKPLSEKEKRFLTRMEKKYRTKDIDELLIRVNTLPPSLVIAQAAIESGWGTSRFFVEGHNIFGIWTFDNKTEAIQAKNSTARVRKYTSLLSSIEDYYYNINTGWAYRDLRIARLKERNALKLAKYLRNYSILRDEYVRRLQRVIRKNNLQQFDNCIYDNCTVKL
ncbi:glucosaminidase domain-containing protein [Desulfurobacterium sp.]